MYKIFIVGDETCLQDELILLLNKRNDIDIIGNCKSVKEGQIILSNINVDLVLMDVQLEDGKSIEILEYLKEVNFDVIFITAYNKYAIKAIKNGALDYILKPIDEKELNIIINKFIRKKKSTKPNSNKLSLNKSYSTFKGKLVIKNIDAMFFIDVKQICYCKGDGNYTTFYLNNQKEILSSKPLKEYVNILPKSEFIKTHQSYLVNKNYVDFYNNSYELVMLNGLHIPVSIRKKEKVIQKLTE